LNDNLMYRVLLSRSIYTIHIYSPFEYAKDIFMFISCVSSWERSF